MSFAIPICAACGAAAFPPRALCPRCGGREWRTEAVEHGVVEHVTERDGTGIAAVRTALGPVVVARVEAAVRPGETAALDADGGVPLVRGAG